MHLVVVDACDKIVLHKENEIEMITVYKQMSSMPACDTSWPEGRKSMQIGFWHTVRTSEKHFVNTGLSLPFWNLENFSLWS